MFQFLITVCIDLQVGTHTTMRHLERILHLLSRRGGFAVLKYSSEYTGKTARLIQLMPHCSLWIVPGSPGYLWWSVIIGCVVVSECDGPNRGSQGSSTPRCTIRKPLALHIGWKGRAVSTFIISSPSVESYLVGSREASLGFNGSRGLKALMRIDNTVIHAPTVLLWLESNISEIKMLFVFAEAPYGDTRTPFYRSCRPHIVRTNACACSVGSARRSLLSLFRLKVASLVTRQLFSAYEWASLLRVSGAKKANMLFFLLPSDQLLLFK